MADEALCDLAEAVVHDSVELVADQVWSRVLGSRGDLPDERRIRRIRLDRRSEVAPPGAGHLLGGVQPPTVGSAARPVPDDAVAGAVDEVADRGICVVQLR